MSRGYSVPVLHQQDGGMSLQAFAEREGLTPGQVKRCIRRGKVLGAQQDSRSKHWWIYPPAKLLERPRSHQQREAVAGFDVAGGSHAPDEEAALRLPVHPTEAREGHAEGGIPEGGRCTPTTEGKAEGIPPPAKQLLTWRNTPEAYTGARNVCRMLHEAAARQHREGIHYLRLDGREFSRLYAALDHERSRIRKLVGKGLAAVGELRATDSVWQKMQAMCREGRLL